MRFNAAFVTTPVGMLNVLRSHTKGPGAAHLRALELWHELAGMSDWREEYGHAVGCCHPKINTLAERMRCSRRVVEQASAKLQQAGFLVVETGRDKGRSNGWFLLFAGGAKKPSQWREENDAPTSKVVPRFAIPKPSSKVSAVSETRRPTFAERSKATQETGDGSTPFSLNGSARPFCDAWPSKRGGPLKVQRKWVRLTPEQRAAAFAVAAVYATCWKLARPEQRRFCPSPQSYLRDHGWQTDLAAVCAIFGLIPEDLTSQERAQAAKILAKFASVE